MTLELLEETQEQLTLFVADSPARIYQWPESARGLLENGLDYGSSLRELLTNLSRDGLLLKTSPVYYPQIEGQTLPLSFDGWSNAGMAFAGGYLTLSISEFPSGASASSLSDILETGDLPRRFFLSSTACRGILRRAARRGKELPPALENALRAAS